MFITEAKSLIIAHILANEPVMVWSDPGVGKSDLMHEIANELFNGVIFDRFRASQLENCDVIGVPSVEQGLTRWNPPAILPNEARDGKEGMFFIDEINTNKSVEASLMQLVLQRKAGSYEMPKGWRVTAAGNYVSNKAAGTRMGTALAGRFAHIHIEPSFKAWKAWALANNIAHEIISFLDWCEQRGINHFHRLPDQSNEKDLSYPSARNWARCSKVLAQAPMSGYAVAKANVGEMVAIEFKAFLDVFRTLPTIQEIVRDPLNAKLPLEPSAQFAVASLCSRMATAQTFAAIIQYVSRFSPAFAVMAITDATRRDANLKQAHGYAQWAVANPDII